jgi:hypothetical protein
LLGLLWWWCLRAGVGVGLALMTILAPLLTFSLHFVPLLLLGRVEERTDLRVGALVDIHHFAVAILLRDRSVLAQAIHLGSSRLENFLHFGLLIGGKAKFFSQLLGPPGRVGRTVVAIALRRRGWLIIGRIILCRGERCNDRNESGGDKNEQGVLKHRILLLKFD